MDCINSYAIVAYVAGPVAGFADRLRKELVPGCPHHAHITILPPRPLPCSLSEVTEFARPLVAQFEPFDVRFGAVEQFPDTQVIYLSLASSACEFITLHDVLNTGILEQKELYDYVPHITLGQLLAPGTFEGCLELSRRRWREFGAAKPSRIETVTMVQQRADGSWKDLAELGLGRVPAVG